MGETISILVESTVYLIKGTESCALSLSYSSLSLLYCIVKLIHVNAFPKTFRSNR